MPQPTLFGNLSPQPGRSHHEAGDESHQHEFTFGHCEHAYAGIMRPMEGASAISMDWGAGAPGGWPSPTADCASSPCAVVVGLGGNLGDVRQHFCLALQELREVSPSGRVASLYQSAPIGPPQAPFLNSAVVIHWCRDLPSLLTELLRIEQLADRKRTQRWGPRTLDLDLLWASRRFFRSSSLTVPHPRLLERRFALEPLIELIPGALDPRTNSALGPVLASLKKQELGKVSANPW